MGKRIGRVIGCACVALFILGCASRGPLVVKPPSVRVSELQSLTFSPDLVTFQAKVFIRNNMPVDLDFQRTEWAVDLYDSQLFAESFDGMKRTRGDGTQTVTFPFQIAMKDVLAQSSPMLSEGQLRVTIHGEVFPAGNFGFDAIPFTGSLEIPLPIIPAVTLLGVRGVPFTDAFRIIFRVTNPNSFPYTVDTVKTYAELGGTRYPLLHTLRATEIPAGDAGIVELQMENVQGKALGMALNLAQDPNAVLAVGGTIQCRTPYGWLLFPVRFDVPLRR